MATELQQMIDVVAKDKGIEPAIVIGAIEDAYLAASRKVFKTDEDLRTRCAMTCLAVCAAMRPSFSVSFGNSISIPTSASSP